MPECKVRIAFLDVGQGDTIVISVPETQEAVIVDCIDADAVLSYLERNEIQHIRGLIITHLHLDHYKEAIALIDNVQSELGLSCERIFFHQPRVDSQIWEKLRQDEDGHSIGLVDKKTQECQRKTVSIDLFRWAQENRHRYNNLTKQPGITLPLPDIIEFIYPWEVDISFLTSHSLNDTSGVLKVHSSGSSALLTGDLEPFGWEYLKKNYTNLHSDVLKFPHHGAWKDCSPDDLLDTVDPSIVVISVGTSGVAYHHPNSHVFDSLAARPHIHFLCTQATQQCTKRIQEQRSQVTECLQRHTSESDGFFVEQRGCPCAGTIVVELGDSVRLLQPDPDFHHNSIVEPYYPDHKCMMRR